MTIPIFFLGFGEAAQSFCGDDRWQGDACGYDIKLEQPELRESKAQEFKQFGVLAKGRMTSISGCSETVLSVVTADQALHAAESVTPYLARGSMYLDMNSAAPKTKQAAANSLRECGVQYVDVAIMAPVNPKQLDVPLLLSGPEAEQASEKLAAIGFQTVKIVGDQIGQASSIKMLRSVMIKGIEALTYECAAGAARAGVVNEVFESMGADGLEQADYKLDRMMVHGVRRAAEMEEVVKTLEDLGVDPIMSRGTVQRHSEIGTLGINPPPKELSGKLKALNLRHKEAAE